MSTKSMDAAYIKRPVEVRMTNLIEDALPGGQDTALDIGCGAGIYGKALSLRADRVFGLDLSASLCEAARATGGYERVICDSVGTVTTHFDSVDLVFCSEVLEHLEGSTRTDAIAAIHELRPNTVVFTTPNPLSPTYHNDPTHVAKYTIYSMARELNADPDYDYRLRALGFAHYNLAKSRLCRLLNPFSSRLAILSPTVAYVGSRREREQPRCLPSDEKVGICC